MMLESRTSNTPYPTTANFSWDTYNRLWAELISLNPGLLSHKATWPNYAQQATREELTKAVDAMCKETYEAACSLSLMLRPLACMRAGQVYDKARELFYHVIGEVAP